MAFLLPCAISCGEYVLINRRTDRPEKRYNVLRNVRDGSMFGDVFVTYTRRLAGQGRNVGLFRRVNALGKHARKPWPMALSQVYDGVSIMMWWNMAEDPSKMLAL